MSPGRVLAVAALGLILAPVPTALAQTAAELFDTRTLQEVRLFINSRDLLRLRDRYLENTYYPADLQWRNIRVRNVAVRSRGVASRSSTKLGLRIDFDYYTTGQRFLGLKALLLDNFWTDPAMIRERLAMAMFERMGQAAPRESFCRLFINNVYQGAYAIVEAIDTEFVSRTLGESTGYLFEYHFVEPFFAQDLGDDFEPYKLRFEPQNHKLEADIVLYGPIRAMFREINGPDDAVWRERVARYLDLQQYMTHVAIESCVAENDGLLGHSGMANFYLYRFADSTRHRFLPWDKDNAFHQIDAPVLLRAEDSYLFPRALAYSDLREIFLQTLEQCAQAAAEDEWLAAEVEREASVISTAAHEDSRKPFSNEEFDQAIDSLREFAKSRPAFVLDEVARLRSIQ